MARWWHYGYVHHVIRIWRACPPERCAKTSVIAALLAGVTSFFIN